MRIVKEMSLTDFTPWSGAVPTYNRVKEEDKLDLLESLLEKILTDIPTESELNDIFWFESEWIYEILGMKSEEEED